MTPLLELLASLALIGAMVGAMEVGRRIGRRRLAADAAHANAGVGAVEAAVFGLLGLLLAFTFSGAWQRFDARRELILQEANALGTAWLRLDLLPAATAEGLRAELRAYTDLRLAQSRAGATTASTELLARQQRIWASAVAAAQSASDVRVASVVLPALNDVFDLATARYVAAQTHPPRIVFVILIALTLAAASLAGYGMAASARRSWLHIAVFSGCLLAAIYVSLEMEYPRGGLIRLDHYDRVLVEVRAGMK